MQYLLSQKIDLAQDIMDQIIMLFDKTSLLSENQTNNKFCNILFTYIKSYKNQLLPYKKQLINILNRCKSVIIKPSLTMLEHI